MALHHNSLSLVLRLTMELVCITKTLKATLSCTRLVKYHNKVSSLSVETAPIRTLQGSGHIKGFSREGDTF